MSDLIERLREQAIYYSDAEDSALFSEAATALAAAQAEVARLGAALRQIVHEFRGIKNGHRAAQIAQAALLPVARDEMEG